MWEWSDKLKLGKSSHFVKKKLRLLPKTEVEFEADFFFEPESSDGDQEQWMGMVVERDCGSVLAMEDVRLPPPTVNSLASLLAHAMFRPLDTEDRQRPSTIYLRDRCQWQELLPHLRQLGIEVVLSEDLPRFDEAVIEWMQQTKRKKLSSADEIKATLRKPFPERKRTCFTDAIDIMEWTDAMHKGAYPSSKVAVPNYGSTTVVPIRLTAEELEVLLTETSIAKTKKLRPRLEAIAAEGTSIDLDINDWCTVLLALCETRGLGIAVRIANHLAEALGIDAPSFRT